MLNKLKLDSIYVKSRQDWNGCLLDFEDISCFIQNVGLYSDIEIVDLNEG